MSADAPGRPGHEPRWTSSAKDAVGTARSAAAPVWFTLSHGILNEVYFPRVDRACLRDAEFLVIAADGGFFEEKRDGRHETRPIAASVPAYVVETEDPAGRFRLTKRFVTDPLRPTLLIDATFTSETPLGTETLVFLLAPHLDNHGGGNSMWVGDYKGTPAMFARRGAAALAVVTDAPVLAASAGYVGVSDPWQELRGSGRLPEDRASASDGNVAGALQIDVASCRGRFTIAVGFGTTPAEAGQRAVAGVHDGFDAALDGYSVAWRDWAAGLHLPELDEPDPLARTSATVLATHEASTFPGGLIASLSIPWGSSRGDGDLGGYHLVWPRDLSEAAGALLAIGADGESLRALSYLRATQEVDGHWAQNMWLDGTPYWHGIQLDETALPVLLVDLARSTGALDDQAVAGYLPMVRAAAGYLVRNGPVTAQDRWEEDGGYSPFTLATEIAALLVAAEWTERGGEPGVARYLRETADCWDAHIETWCYLSGTDLAGEVGVEGSYVRIGPPDTGGAVTPLQGWIPIKNRPPGEDRAPARSVVSPDALALVRFGLRRPDDPRILNTIRVIDAVLKTEFPFGPGWRRYNDDGYGEHADGRPFDGTGRGRVWPLLTGERGHVAVAAGDLGAAADLARTMRSMAGPGGLLPEQVWDAPDLPERELWFGKPTGSAMPLVWAHAEYLKLLRSIDDGAVFDLPAPVRRHRPDPGARSRRFWRANHKIRQIEEGASLRIELPAPACVHWSVDGWTTATDSAAVDSGIGMHVVDFDAAMLPPGSVLRFTIRWEDRWEGTDYEIAVGGGSL